MNPALGIALMLNNYVHDVATGLLLISALWLGWSARDLGDSPSPELVSTFRRTYARCVRFVAVSIVVIVATGIVRTIFFMEFEWMPALGRGLVQVLVLKHVLIFAMLAAGIYAWLQIRKRVAQLA
jgi:putative copper export protein